MTQFSSGASSKQHDATLQTSVQKRPWLSAQRAARSGGGGGIITVLVTVDSSVLVVELVIASFVEIVTNEVFSVDDSSPGIIEFEYCAALKLMAIVSFETVFELSGGPSKTMLVLSEVKLLFVAVISLKTVLELKGIKSAFVPFETLELSVAPVDVSFIVFRLISADCNKERQVE